MYYATLTRRKWRCDNATMHQCVTVTLTQWKNHSHKHGYHQERSNENKNRKTKEKKKSNNNNNNNNHDDHDDDDDFDDDDDDDNDNGKTNQWRDKNKLNTPTRFNASWVSKNKPKPKLWNQECDNTKRIDPSQYQNNHCNNDMNKNGRA